MPAHQIRALSVSELQPQPKNARTHSKKQVRQIAESNKGTCDNFLTVRRDELEAKVLDGLRHHLMHPELVRTFVDEFHREVNRQAADRDMRRNRTERDLERTERDIRRVIEAIKAGVPGAAIKDEMTTLEGRRIALLVQLGETPPPMPVCIQTLPRCTAKRSSIWAKP